MNLTTCQGEAEMVFVITTICFRNHAEQGSPLRQMTLSVRKYPTEAKALVRLQEDLLRINGPQA